THLSEISPLGASMAGLNVPFSITALEISPTNQFLIAEAGQQSFRTYSPAGVSGVGSLPILPSQYDWINVLAAASPTNVWLAYGPEFASSTTLESYAAGSAVTSATTGVKNPQ